MRNVLAVFLCVSLAGASAATAQTLGSEDALQFGLKGGLTLSTFGGADSDEFDNALKKKVGLIAGGWLDIPLAPSFSIQPEALLVNKGAKSSQSFFGEVLDISYNLTYLDVPVLLKWTQDRSGETSPFFYAGPSLGFKLRSVVNVSDGDDDESDDLDDTKTTDFGLVIGGGTQFGRFSIEGRFTRALTTLHSESNDDARSDIRNTALSVILGIALGSR